MKVKDLEYSEALPENKAYIRPKEAAPGVVSFFGEVGKNFIVQTINILPNNQPEFSFIYTVSSRLEFYSSPLWNNDYHNGLLVALNNETGCISIYNRFAQLYSTTQTSIYPDIDMINLKFQIIFQGHFANESQTIQLKTKSNFHNPELNKPDNYER